MDYFQVPINAVIVQVKFYFTCPHYLSGKWNKSLRALYEQYRDVILLESGID